MTDSRTLAMYHTEVCVFEEMHKVVFCGLLERQQGKGRDAPARVVEIQDDLAHEAPPGEEQGVTSLNC